VPAGAVVGSTEHFRGHDQLRGSLRVEWQCAECHRTTARQSDLVVDLYDRERVVGFGQ
jgi:hypothetical protein